MSQKDLLQRTSEGNLVVLYESDGMRSAVIAAILDESQTENVAKIAVSLRKGFKIEAFKVVCKQLFRK